VCTVGRVQQLFGREDTDFISYTVHVSGANESDRFLLLENCLQTNKTQGRPIYLTQQLMSRNQFMTVFFFSGMLWKSVIRD